MTRSPFLRLCKPFVRLIPQVAPAPKPLPDFYERVKWTAVALIIFLVCCQIPVFGAKPPGSSDPFYWMRVILASNKGTLMEFGISPIVTASMIMQLVQAAKLIDMDPKSKEDQKLFSGAQKLLGIVIVFFEVIAYVLGGMYGEISEIGMLAAAAIIFQLIVSCIICILLDDLLTSGWGLGNGISLFIACNIAETILWKMFSPIFVNLGRGNEVEGAVFAFFHLMFARADKSRALMEAVYRPQLPNISNLLATLLIFTIVIFLQGFQVNLTMVSKKQAGFVYQYPIKLFYTSNMPIILQTAMVSNLFFISKLLFHRLGNDNILCAFFGRWETPEYAGNEGQTVPVAGLAYYVTAPNGLSAMYSDPIHALVYLAFMLGSCALFARLWIEMSGSSPRDVAKKLKEENLMIKGFRGDDKAIIGELKRYIPTAAAFGGIMVGVLSVLGDQLGAIGSGTGILLAVSIITEYHEIIQKESKPQTAASRYQSHVELRAGGG